MWKLTLCFNVLVLALFWILSQVAITPVHNLLVTYAETGADLPILTDFAIQSRSASIFIPAAWAVFAMFLGRQLQSHAETKRSEWLLLHLSLSLLLGLSMFFFFTLAGILPFLKIGVLIG